MFSYFLILSYHFPLIPKRASYEIWQYACAGVMCGIRAVVQTCSGVQKSDPLEKFTQPDFIGGPSNNKANNKNI